MAGTGGGGFLDGTGGGGFLDGGADGFTTLVGVGDGFTRLADRASSWFKSSNKADGLPGPSSHQVFHVDPDVVLIVASCAAKGLQPKGYRKKQHQYDCI